jgi:tRNA(fMet)-specific endonuclease VapC
LASLYSNPLTFYHQLYHGQSTGHDIIEIFISLPFDDIAALTAGRIRAQLANLGTPIGLNDLLIASIALTHNLTLVTHNTGEFVRVKGLQIEDWEEEN